MCSSCEICKHSIERDDLFELMHGQCVHNEVDPENWTG